MKNFCLFSLKKKVGLKSTTKNKNYIYGKNLSEYGKLKLLNSFPLFILDLKLNSIQYFPYDSLSIFLKKYMLNKTKQLQQSKIKRTFDNNDRKKYLIFIHT